MSIQLVVFSLDGNEYGFDVSAINGILRSNKFKIKTLPGADPAIAGMINLRGAISYIFDLRVKFNLPQKEISEDSKFIMLNSNGSTTGCIVDEVTDIIKLGDDQVQAAPEFISGCNKKHISGIGKIEERMIVILNPEKIFTTESN